MRLDHIQLAIPQGSENKCRQFWIGCLHFEEIEKPEPLRARGGAWFLKDTLEVHLGVETPFSAAQRAQPGIATDGLHTLAEKLQNMAIPFNGTDLSQIGTAFLPLILLETGLNF